MQILELSSPLLLIILLPFAMSFIKPEIDGRSYFAVIMSEILELHMRTHAEATSYVISPAAVQKTLAILYNSAEDNDNLLDLMLIEMGLKYYDAMRLMETAMEEMTVFDTLKEDRFEKLDQPIERSDALDFFKRDFNELPNDIFYSTIITTPSDLRLSTEFKKFAKDFFNASILQESDQKLKDFYSSSGIATNEVPQNRLNLYNEINFKGIWRPNFIETPTDHLSTRGHFRFGEIVNSEDDRLSVQILELPLEAHIPLSVLLIAPKYADNLTWGMNYEVIRPLTDPSTISKILKQHTVEVKLPKIFDFECKTELIGYLRENGVTRAKIYEAPQKFSGFFNVNSSKRSISIGKFWQNIKLNIEAKVVKELPPVHHGGLLNTIKEKIIDLTQTETFDITEKPFLYILKSDEVPYFMGYINGKFPRQ